MHALHKQLGFHLLELLMVLALVGILSTIGFPIYSEFLMYTKRSEAKAELIKLAIALENYFQRHQSYQGASLKTLGFNKTIAHNNYVLTIKIDSENNFLVTAQSVPTLKDYTCVTFQLSSSGKKSFTGTGNTKDCW